MNDDPVENTFKNLQSLFDELCIKSTCENLLKSPLAELLYRSNKRDAEVLHSNNILVLKIPDEKLVDSIPSKDCISTALYVPEDTMRIDNCETKTHSWGITILSNGDVVVLYYSVYGVINFVGNLYSVHNSSLLGSVQISKYSGGESKKSVYDNCSLLG